MNQQHPAGACVQDVNVRRAPERQSLKATGSMKESELVRERLKTICAKHCVPPVTKAILKHLHIKVYIFPASPLKASVSLAAFQLNFLQVTHFRAFIIMDGGLFEDEIADFFIYI